MALGITSFLPTTDQFDFDKRQAEAQIAVGMACLLYTSRCV